MYNGITPKISIVDDLTENIIVKPTLKPAGKYQFIEAVNGIESVESHGGTIKAYNENNHAIFEVEI